MDRTKRSCILMFICLWISTGVWAQEVIHVEVAGTLPTLIGDKKGTVEELTLTGYLNGTDIKCIRQMNKLICLDMKGANIIAGGEAYGYDNQMWCSRDIYINNSSFGFRF